MNARVVGASKANRDAYYLVAIPNAGEHRLTAGPQ